MFEKTKISLDTIVDFYLFYSFLVVERAIDEQKQKKKHFYVEEIIKIKFMEKNDFLSHFVSKVFLLQLFCFPT